MDCFECRLTDLGANDYHEIADGLSLVDQDSLDASIQGSNPQWSHFSPSSRSGISVASTQNNVDEKRGQYFVTDEQD